MVSMSTRFIFLDGFPQTVRKVLQSHMESYEYGPGSYYWWSMSCIGEVATKSLGTVHVALINEHLRGLGVRETENVLILHNARRVKGRNTFAVLPFVDGPPSVEMAQVEAEAMDSFIAAFPLGGDASGTIPMTREDYILALAMMYEHGYDDAAMQT